MTEQAKTTDAPISDEQFKVLFELRAIPFRKSNYLILRGEQAKTADELVARGLVVFSKGGLSPHELTYRLNKEGLDVLTAEWVLRGQPTRKELFGDGQ